MRFLIRSLIQTAALSLLFVSVNRVSATEVDHYTTASTPLRDETSALNKLVNSFIKDSLYFANGRANSCDRDALFASMSILLGDTFITPFEQKIKESKTIDKANVEWTASIYRDLSAREAPAISVGLGGIRGCCASVISVANQRIGADKIGHFFNQGFEYFILGHQKQGAVAQLIRGLQFLNPNSSGMDSATLDLEQATSWGTQTEESMFGYTTTGVKSFGDLAANLDGLQFWQNFFDGPNPYVKCIKGKFTQVQDFDWNTYVNPAWDESINCNDYKTQQIADKVHRRVLEQERKQKANLECPRDPFGCILAQEHYGKNSRLVLHPSCLKAQVPPQDRIDSSLSNTKRCPAGSSTGASRFGSDVRH